MIVSSFVGLDYHYSLHGKEWRRDDLGLVVVSPDDESNDLLSVNAGECTRAGCCRCSRCCIW